MFKQTINPVRDTALFVVYLLLYQYNFLLDSVLQNPRDFTDRPESDPAFDILLGQSVLTFCRPRLVRPLENSLLVQGKLITEAKTSPSDGPTFWRDSVRSSAVISFMSSVVVTTFTLSVGINFWLSLHAHTLISCMSNTTKWAHFSARTKPNWFQTAHI